MIFYILSQYCWFLSTEDLVMDLNYRQEILDDGFDNILIAKLGQLIWHPTEQRIVIGKDGDHKILGADVEEEVVDKVVDVLVEEELVGAVLVADHFEQFVQGSERQPDQRRH